MTNVISGNFYRAVGLEQRWQEAEQSCEIAKGAQLGSTVREGQPLQGQARSCRSHGQNLQ